MAETPEASPPPSPPSPPPSPMPVSPPPVVTPASKPPIPEREATVSAVPAVPAAPAAPPAPPPPTVVFYKGSVSHWTACKHYAGAGVLGLWGLAAFVFGVYDTYYPIAKLGERAALLGRIGTFGGIGLLVVAAVIISSIRMSVRSNRYAVTSRLIERETGVFETKVDALDLGKVKHVDMTQTVMEKMLNIGTIEVFSADQEEPILLIKDIPNPRPVYEKLRDAVIDLSRSRTLVVQ